MGSISKSEIKFVRSLHRKKGRRDASAFIIEGEKLLNEALECGVQIRSLYTVDETNNQNAQLVSEKEMSQLSCMTSPSQILGIVDLKSLRHNDGNAISNWLILDGISDPGNLGTIIRTADWFGIKNILLSPDCVDPYNPKVVQATMGSIFRVNLVMADIEEFVQRLKTQSSGFKCYGASLGGSNLHALSGHDHNCALIIGSESHGIKPHILALCDAVVTIPAKGKAESLNAGIAAGILLYEWSGKLSPQN